MRRALISAVARLVLATASRADKLSVVPEGGRVADLVSAPAPGPP
jgi:hypothetical protein